MILVCLCTCLGYTKNSINCDCSVTDFASKMSLLVSGIQEIQTFKRLFSLPMVSCQLGDKGKHLYNGQEDPS